MPPRFDLMRRDPEPRPTIADYLDDAAVERLNGIFRHMPKLHLPNPKVFDDAERHFPKRSFPKRWD